MVDAHGGRNMTINRDALHSLDLSGLEDADAGTRPAPGSILRHEFLEPSGLSAYALARAIGVPLARVRAILHGSRAITADTALRLAGHFGNSAEFWMNLQVIHDLEVAREARAA